MVIPIFGFAHIDKYPMKQKVKRFIQEEKERKTKKQGKERTKWIIPRSPLNPYMWPANKNKLLLLYQ
jgi:hypothetical protein